MAQSTSHNKLNEDWLINFLLGALLLSLFKGSRASTDNSEASFAPDIDEKKSYPSGTDFINAFKDQAAYLQQFYLIPQEVTLAQALLESAHGSSYLATHDNNFFGIVADPSWKGPVSIPNAQGVKFRSYDTPKDSFIDYAKFLVGNKNYADAFTTSDPADFAQAVADGGYGGADHAGYAKILLDNMNIVNGILGK
jgi:flagellar protein FlgJ